MPELNLEFPSFYGRSSHILIFNTLAAMGLEFYVRIPLVMVEFSGYGVRTRPALNTLD